MRIKALNEPETPATTSDESSTDEGKQVSLSKEALEDQYFDKYRQALLAIQNNREDEAKELLEELDDELDCSSDSEGATFAQLKFSVLRNLGNLEPHSIEHYTRALSIDSSDISLWLKVGDRALDMHKFHLARLSYERALTINDKNWIAIDKLIDIYYILHLPFELDDICSRALTLNSKHKKALIMLEEASKLQPTFHQQSGSTVELNEIRDRIVVPLQEAKRKRRQQMQNELQCFKRARLSITLDTMRTQSMASFGNYIIKVYERFAKQCITRNTMIDITINNTSCLTQQLSNGSINSQSINQNSSEPQTTSSQDVEMRIESEQVSNSENEKVDHRNEVVSSNDDNDQANKTNKGRASRSNPSAQKSSSLSFAAMLFPMDLNDKRRSSRNRSNQDDTFSFKMKFDELNELLPENLRLGAIEQTLQKRREEQQKNVQMNDDEQEESVLVETNLDPVREDLIIKDVIEGLSSSCATTNNIKLCDMFYVYLSKLAPRKQNTLPDAYSKIYKFYRKLCPLPNDVFIDIGLNGIELEELWFTLTANEITYRANECLLLLRILEQLSIHLDEVQHKEFLVRLFLILGLNSDYRYLEVALDNIEEDTKVYASNRKIITRAYIKTLIDRKTEKLQQETVGDSDNSLEIINKLAPKSENETSVREIQLLCDAIKAAKLWQRGLDILNQRNDLNSDAIMDTINTCLSNGAWMDAILASKLCKEAISGSRPITWTCLYRGWIGTMSKDELCSEKNIENISKFFDLGHQTLGKKGCCTADQGEFLMLHVKHLLDEDRDSFDERNLLASLNCLFGYPSKKPVSVAGHKTTRVPIIWEYAEVIYPYLTPEELPTYMSLLRKIGISSEVEALLREIAEVVPQDFSPKPKVHLIEGFIEKGEPLDVSSVKKTDVTEDLFYYLADYYFKNKDFSKARKFYHYDLIINPTRFDSWAASGLLRASGIDKALSEGTITTADFVQGSFRDLADSAIRCFEQATQLRPNEPKATLWIEFGNLTYNLTSLASRLFIYDDFELEIDDKEPQFTEKLVRRHKYLYELALSCFRSANQQCACDEVWLHYYMLGKIYEKTDTLKALEFYYKADAQLYHEGASYPRKIPYHNPPDLAYEAMELHYRINAAALKFLLTESDLTQDQMNRVKRFLLNAQRSPFVEMEGFVDPKDSMEKCISRDVSLLLGDTIDAVLEDAVYDDLIFMCLHGMKRCLIRYDKNFKALYRLAFYYRKIKDPHMAQDILISRDIRTDRRIQALLNRRPELPDFMSAPPDLNGADSLFKDRKIGNLFFNIWRIPAEEIDRPGCFEHWMFKCTWLLIKTCFELRNTDMLTVIAFQLSRQPETSKKYLQNKPRVLLALFAAKSVISVVMDAIDKTENLERTQYYIREGMALVDKFVKANVFPDMMRDLYEQLQARCASSLNLPPASG